MYNEDEILLNFPLRKPHYNRENDKFPGYKKDAAVKESLRRFYKLAEKYRNNEWHQEYFLIYNSYIIENA